jgi:hypothetical protein
VVTDPIQVALRVADALEACGVHYVVGGSVASPISGEPRSTLDIDVVVALTEAEVDRLVAALGDEFHADAIALRAAVREKSSANVIHLGSSTKVDLFISGSSPLDDLQMDRRPADNAVRSCTHSHPPRAFLAAHAAPDTDPAVIRANFDGTGDSSVVIVDNAHDDLTAARAAESGVKGHASGTERAAPRGTAPPSRVWRPSSQTGTTFSAAGPFSPWTTSNSTL